MVSAAGGTRLPTNPLVETIPAGYARPHEECCRGLLRALREAGTLSADRRYRAGDLVCSEDENGSALYVVLSGVVRLSVFGPEARETTLRLAGPWEFAGVPLPGWAPPRSVRAEAFTACEVVKVPKVFVERAVRESPDVALMLATLLGLELAHREELFGCLLPRTTEARLARLLPILARQFGEASGRGVTIEVRLTHYDLAAMVASTRESVTAAMTALRRRGVIEKRGGIISILKPEALVQDPL